MWLACSGRSLRSLHVLLVCAWAVLMHLPSLGSESTRSCRLCSRRRRIGESSPVLHRAARDSACEPLSDFAAIGRAHERQPLADGEQDRVARHLSSACPIRVTRRNLKETMPCPAVWRVGEMNLEFTVNLRTRLHPLRRASEECRRSYSAHDSPDSKS
jgi:hypothetical protein